MNGPFKSRLKRRAEYDLEAEQRIVCAAIMRPTMLDGKTKLKLGQFFDPFLADMYNKGRNLHALGEDTIKGLAKLIPADSWFFVDEELSGMDLLWQMFDLYFDQTEQELEEAIERVIACAEARS